MKLSEIAILITMLTFQAAHPQQTGSPIRSIDFANFTYPGSTYGQYQTPYPEERFTLRNGKYGDWRYGMTLANVFYGDVTGDGKEAAILVFGQQTEGNAAYHSVYVYALEHHRPKMLWAFMTGDRADGGLRRVFAEDGKLVVELFGKETRIEGGSATSSTEFSGLCCPKSYTRTRYQWRGREFRRDGGMEVEANPAAKSGCPACPPKED